jgi:hypothetical protein
MGPCRSYVYVYVRGGGGRGMGAGEGRIILNLLDVTKKTDRVQGREWLSKFVIGSWLCVYCLK